MASSTSADGGGDGDGGGGGAPGAGDLPGPLVDLTDLFEPPPRDCVPPGSPIHTRNGLVPIELLQPTDVVDFTQEPLLTSSLAGVALPSELPTLGTPFNPGPVLSRQLESGQGAIVCQGNGSGDSPSPIFPFPRPTAPAKKEETPPRGTRRVRESCETDQDCANERGFCHQKKSGDKVCLDCSREEYAEFRKFIHGNLPDVELPEGDDGSQPTFPSFCDHRPRACLAVQVDDPARALAEVEERIANAERCLAARTGERDRCFGGGDPDDDGHSIQINQVATSKAFCQCLAEVLRLDGLTRRALDNGRDTCRNRFRGRGSNPKPGF